MTKTQLFGLIALLLLSALLGFGILTSGHNWAYSDFSAYIMQAQSILDGDLAGFITHNSITVLESDLPIGPIAYPWGYPLLLAPLIALLGISTLAMKLLNTLLYLLFLVSFFFLLRKRLSYFNSLLLTALFAFNPVFLAAQDYILSDIAFLFFSTFAIFLIDRCDFSRDPNRLAYLKEIAIGIIIFAAFLTRTNGLLLLPTLFFYQLHLLLNRKDAFHAGKKHLLLFALPYLSFFSLWAISSLIFPGGQASHLSHYQNFQFSQLGSYLLFYTKLGESFFAEILYAKIVYALFGFFFFAGILLKFKENILFILYFSLTLLLYISWPYTQGIRFLFPILPLFIYLAAQGFDALLSLLPKKIKPTLTLFPRIAISLLALLFFSLSAQAAAENIQNERAIHGPFDEVSIELFEYIKKNLPEDSLIIFFKPRVMRLMTDRDAILVLSCENLSKGDYVVINKKWEDMGQIAPEEIESCPADLENIYKNRRFIIYQIGK